MKPILFNSEMVQAILDGRKTCTRRLIKPQPAEGAELSDDYWSMVEFANTPPHDDVPMIDLAHKPFVRGDVLWVRETWQQNYDGSYSYRAGHKFEAERGWRPSIHMPKEAARIFLRVKDVRAERLQDMTCDDMLAEGVIPKTVKGGSWQQWQQDYMRPVWNSTIKPSEYGLYSWGTNPWVWVIEFKRISREEAEANV